MIKFLIGVFVLVFVVPSVIFSIWAHFEEKKAAKNKNDSSWETYTVEKTEEDEPAAADEQPSEPDQTAEVQESEKEKEEEA